MGQRIRFWRLVWGWTQSQMAGEAAKIAGIKDGLTKSFMALLEEDRTRAAVDSLHGIARALGVTMDYLVTGEEGVKRQTPKIDLRPIIKRAREKQAERIRLEARKLKREPAEGGKDGVA